CWVRRWVLSVRSFVTWQELSARPADPTTEHPTAASIAGESQSLGQLLPSGGAEVRKLAL
ncbi:MAG: hypothetical protein KJO95_04100, partial [Gammaproteobacteria bacterium]|nr:hypothetical protein [Gammaproteobacteria bacterium]